MEYLIQDEWISWVWKIHFIWSIERRLFLVTRAFLREITELSPHHLLLVLGRVLVVVFPKKNYISKMQFFSPPDGLSSKKHSDHYQFNSPSLFKLIFKKCFYLPIKHHHSPLMCYLLIFAAWEVIREISSFKNSILPYQNKSYLWVPSAPTYLVLPHV